MMRVNTNKIRKPDIFPEKWILNGNYEEIRPYRLLIKILPNSPLTISNKIIFSSTPKDYIISAMNKKD